MDNRRLTLGSLFDGSGAFPLGGLLCGIEPVWASEVEPFPIRVTTKRLPFLKHLGDVNKINGAEIPPVDIITAGFPCQNVSISGGRAGLHGERSGLFFQAIRIIKEMRTATASTSPAIAVFENVPGLYSSNHGYDFLEVLNELVKIKDETLSVPMPESGKWLGAGEIMGDGFSLAYRTMDSQFFNVAQRRVRCYIVVDFNGERAGKILSDETRLRGNPAPCRLPWQAAARNPEAGTGVPGGIWPVIGFEPGAASRKGGHCWDNLIGTLRADAGDNLPAVVYDARGNGDGAVVNTITGDHNGHISDYTALAVTPKTLRIRAGRDGGGKGCLLQNDLSGTLGCGNDQTLFVPTCAAFMGGQGADARSIAYSEEVTPTLRSQAGGNTIPMVMTAFGISAYESNAMKSANPTSGIYEAETSRTLDANCCRPDMNQGGIAVVAFTQNQREEVRELGEQSGALNAEPGIHQQTYIMQSREPVCYQDIVGTLAASDYKFPQQQQIHEDKAIVERVTFGNNNFGGWNETPATLTAKGEVLPGGRNLVVENRYAVRRLTPQECAKLQGFYPAYCSGLETPEPNEDDIAFWTDVFETHRKIMGTSSKPKSRKQIIKWLQDPYSDSAEYRMWGNAVTLNVVVFIMGGIVWAAGETGGVNHQSQEANGE